MQCQTLTQVRYQMPPALALEDADLRILIVSEDTNSATALEDTLEGLGYRTTLTAFSARRALSAAVSFSPSVALLDLRLPDMSGFQLAREFRAHLSRHVRDVSLLAVAEGEWFGTGQRARDAGFQGYLTKPILPLELNTWLRRFVCR